MLQKSQKIVLLVLVVAVAYCIFVGHCPPSWVLPLLWGLALQLGILRWIRPNGILFWFVAGKRLSVSGVRFHLGSHMRCGSSGRRLLTGWLWLAQKKGTRLWGCHAAENGQDAILVADASFLCTCMDWHLEFRRRCLTLFRGASATSRMGWLRLHRADYLQGGYKMQLGMMLT